jgi:D-sedoheptulose 7-phosphate isomerase
MVTIALTGSSGFQAEADCVIAVPGEDTQCTQEAHLAIEHIICELVEDALFPPAHA